MVKMHATVVNTHVTVVIRHVTGKQKWHIKLKNYVVTSTCCWRTSRLFHCCIHLKPAELLGGVKVRGVSRNFKTRRFIIVEDVMKKQLVHWLFVQRLLMSIGSILFLSQKQ